MLNLPLYDEDIFGNDAGEDETPEVLSSYFLNKSAFNRFFDKNKILSIVRSRKGMGKSSMLSKMAYDISTEDERAIVIKVTGSDLISFGSFEKTDNQILQNEWKKAISARINLEIGSRLGFAWTDQQMAMVEAAEITGYKGRNIVTSLINRIRLKKLPVEFNVPNAAARQDALLERFQSENPESKVWIFVDDIDSTFSASEIEKARVASFFSACRSLTRDVEGLFIRASVRSDVWTSIRANEDLDKCEQYVTDISWSRTELDKIICNKILSYIKRRHPKHQSAQLSIETQRPAIIEHVFVRRMRWNKSSVQPFQPIRILGARRPRWMSQLCKLSAAAADNRSVSRTTLQDINFVMRNYGRLRVDDIYKEHSHQFSHLQRLIETFANGEHKYTTEELVLKLEASFSPKFTPSAMGKVDGLEYKSSLQLAQLLFKIGFILNRVIPAPGSPPVFIDFQERPELLDDASGSYDGMIWEIHPAYRGVLSIRTQD